MSSEMFMCGAGGPRPRTAYTAPLRHHATNRHLKAKLRFLLFLGHNGQAKDGKLSYAAHVDTAGVLGTGQVERLAKFTAIDFGIGSPSFLHAAALLLEHIDRVEPALQVPAAEFSLVVFLVAGTLARFLDLNFVFGKLQKRCCLSAIRLT